MGYETGSIIIALISGLVLGITLWIIRKITEI